MCTVTITHDVTGAPMVAGMVPGGGDPVRAAAAGRGRSAISSRCWKPAAHVDLAEHRCSRNRDRRGARRRASPRRPETPGQRFATHATEPLPSRPGAPRRIDARAPGAAAFAITPGQGDEAGLRQSKRPHMAPAGKAALAAVQQENGWFGGRRSYRKIDGRTTQAGNGIRHRSATGFFSHRPWDGTPRQSITTAPPCRGKKPSDRLSRAHRGARDRGANRGSSQRPAPAAWVGKSLNLRSSSVIDKRVSASVSCTVGTPHARNIAAWEVGPRP